MGIVDIFVLSVGHSTISSSKEKQLSALSLNKTLPIVSGLGYIYIFFQLY
jgi:hypothetical protein